MKNNSKAEVIKAVSETQDGKALSPKDNFSRFMLNQIEKNIIGEKYEEEYLHFIDVGDLITDFEYMIDQLQRAVKPLKAFKDKWDYAQ